MGSGYSKMKKQARVLEEQYKKMQQERKEIRLEGSAGNGLVKVRMDGEKELKEIYINPECVDKNDLEGLQDLIKAACEDAYLKANDTAPLELSMKGSIFN